MNEKPPGQWARNYSACIQCGQSDTRHMAQGKCQRCYLREWTKRNAGINRAYKRKWYAKAGGKEWARIQREQRNYAGLREPVLRRDNYTCTKCGSIKLLCVHHQDGKGRGTLVPNNTINNLITLCRKCHINAHRAELEAGRRARGWYRPSGLKYKKRKAG